MNKRSLAVSGNLFCSVEDGPPLAASPPVDAVPSIGLLPDPMADGLMPELNLPPSVCSLDAACTASFSFLNNLESDIDKSASQPVASVFLS